MPRTQAFDILGFVPAEAHHGKLSYIDYYVRDPYTQGKRRMRIKLNHIEGASARKAHARNLCQELNRKLSSGWNPLAETGHAQDWKTLREALALFLAAKERDTNHSSPKTYAMFARVFGGWAKGEGLLTKGCSTFTKAHAYRFLDYVRDARGVSNNTYNNYILRGSIFCIWMVERSMRADNPFKGIKRLPRHEKFRTLITEEERAQCLDWFQRNDPPMVTVCMFVFHCLLRPRSELLRIRVQDIDLVNGVVNVDGNKTKSKRIRRPAIPDVMLPYIATSPIMRAAPTDFVVGRGLLPGPVKSGHNTVGNRWDAMRTALGWSKDKQLYSLRDTGIVQLIRDGLDLTYVMRQADHRDIATTNRYVQHYFHKGSEEVRTKASAFKPPGM